MPRRALVAVAVAVTLTAACGATPRVRQPPQPTSLESVGGVWGIEDGSNTVMEIVTATGVPHVDAWASDDKTAFEVSDVSWDGHRLHLRFTYARTHFTSTSDLELVDPQTLEGEGSGVGYRAHEIWRRVPASPPQDKP
jgi:hypothetical protein